MADQTPEEEGSILGVRWTVGLGGEAGRVSGSQSRAAMPSSLMVGHVEAALLVPFWPEASGQAWAHLKGTSQIPPLLTQSSEE